MHGLACAAAHVHFGEEINVYSLHDAFYITSSFLIKA